MLNRSKFHVDNMKYRIKFASEMERLDIISYSKLNEEL